MIKAPNVASLAWGILYGRGYRLMSLRPLLFTGGVLLQRELHVQYNTYSQEIKKCCNVVKFRWLPRLHMLHTSQIAEEALRQYYGHYVFHFSIHFPTEPLIFAMPTTIFVNTLASAGQLPWNHGTLGMMGFTFFFLFLIQFFLG